jgi:hypothetical protein
MEIDRVARSLSPQPLSRERATAFTQVTELIGRGGRGEANGVRPAIGVADAREDLEIFRDMAAFVK